MLILGRIAFCRKSRENLTVYNEISFLYLVLVYITLSGAVTNYTVLKVKKYDNKSPSGELVRDITRDSLKSLIYYNPPLISWIKLYLDAQTSLYTSI